MKNALIIGLFVLSVLLFCFSAGADAQSPDTIVPVIDKPEKVLRKIDIRSITQSGFNFWQDEFTGHWAGIHFGFNGFSRTDYSGYDSEFMKNVMSWSNSTFINPVQQSIGLQRNKNNLGLVTGLGLQLQSYRLYKNITLREDATGKVFPENIGNFDDNQKSKLSVVYLVLPLLAEYQLPVNHYEDRFYISAGLYSGLRLESHTKIKYREERKKEKLKTPSDFSLTKFKYGIMVRTGYRSINLYGTWDISSLFKKGYGPVLTPFSFGVTLISF